MAPLSENGKTLTSPSEKLQSISAWSLYILLCTSMLLRWVPGTWINPTFFEVGLFLMASVWAIQMVCRPYAVRGSFPLIPMAGAIIVPALQVASNQTVSRWETENAVLLGSSNFLAVFFTLQVCRESNRHRRMLQLLALFAFAIILLSLLEHFSAPDRIFGAYQTGFNDGFGLFGSRDRFAAFGELTLSLFVALAFRQKRFAGLWLGMAAATVAAVIGSASRAGAILVTAETIALLLVLKRSSGTQNTGYFNKLVLFAAATAAFIIVVGVEALTARLSDPDPYYGRREMLQSSIQMASERPLVGFGIGNFQNAYPRYARFDSDKVVNHAHNDWAEWAVDGGIPFFACMASLAYWTLPKATNSIWGIGMITVFAHSLVDFPLHDPAMEFWLFALLGMLAAQASNYG